MERQHSPLPSIFAACLLLGTIGSVAAEPTEGFRAGQVGAMTQNLYVGGDILLPLSATSEEDFFEKAAQVIGQILATDFPARSMRLAELMLAERPDLIGLQEVYIIRVCLDPALMICPVANDYLELLLNNLNSEGELYVDAVSVTNIDLQGLPANLPDGAPVFVGITDRDVILVHRDVDVRATASRNFAAALPVEAPFLPGFDRVLRGFVSADVTINGRDYRFVNTHLEVTGRGSPLEPFFRAVQAAQAAELIGMLQADGQTQILAGDFNSDPFDGPIVECLLPDGAGGFVPALCPTPYFSLLQSGYVDVWTERTGRWSLGHTCCQQTLLANASSVLDERVDLLWMRPAEAHYGDPLVRGVRASVIGEEPTGKTTSGLWPSDHAGVAAELILRAPR